MNDSQALKNLEQSAKKEAKQYENTVKEIHKESLQDIKHSLENIHKTSMKSFNKSITELHKESLQEIEQYSKKDKRLIISLTAILSLMIGIIGTIYIKPYLIPSESNKALESKIEQLQTYNQQLQVWQVPNGYQMNAKQGKFIVVPRGKIYTEQEGKIYIKIGD